MKNKIAKSNGILYKIRNFLDRKSLSHLYNSVVFPYLIYGIEVWGNTNAVHLDPIIKIQKKIVRTITFSHYLAHTEPISYTLNILNFNNLVVHRISLMMFKGECSVFKKKIIFLMKTIHYPNTIRSHLVTIVPMAPFTPKSTSKLRSALHFRSSIVIPRFISHAITAQS